MKRRTVQYVISMVALLVVCVLSMNAYAAGEERILTYESDIVVHQDATVGVTETITVAAKGKRIKRGIYRDFPTTYKTRSGSTITVRFDVLNVLLDGAPVHYAVENIENGVRVKIGSKDVFLKPGTYVYTIKYVTDHQIGYFKDYDELYWNVTGDGWDFAIDKVQARVQLPPGAHVVQQDAYTGAYGETGKDFMYGTGERGGVLCSTTRALLPKEGLTIAVAWPKGLVREPSTAEKASFMLAQNIDLLLALLGLLVVFGYYYMTWRRVGKDPAKSVIVPLFAPPKGFSPAAVRFVMRMGFDKKAFSAAIVNMAVKGALTINENDGVFTLIKTGQNLDRLAPGEKKIAQKLFVNDKSVTLKQTNHSVLGNAVKALTNSLKMDFEKDYFKRNLSYLFPGIGLSVLVLAAVALAQPGEEKLLAGFMSVWLSGWTVGCVVIVRSAWIGIKAKSYGLALFALPFVGGEIMGLVMYSLATSFLITGILLLIILINAAFYQWLKAPTYAGRRVMDEIEGFLLFLSVSEKERLEILNPPERTPELFEKYLPYALALDVANQWSEQFSAVLEQSAMVGRAYAPGWYHGNTWNMYDLPAFASAMDGAFASAVSSSSTAPGSTSGSGGGGSSGGGGGGGGGGGW